MRSSCAHHRAAHRLDPAPAAQRRHETRRRLGIDRVQRQDQIADHAIALAAGIVEAGGLIASDMNSARTRLGLFMVKSGAAPAPSHDPARRMQRARLKREPLVDHQRIALIAGMEIGQLLLAQRLSRLHSTVSAP
jgi:hypothetical protein